MALRSGHGRCLSAVILLMSLSGDIGNGLVEPGGSQNSRANIVDGVGDIMP